MNKEKTIIDYLQETYAPRAIILYGSYADGSANENSDFDALIISTDIKKHDSSIISDTVLDVWVYPEKDFQRDFDPDEFIQTFDGKIILDHEGLAENLIKRVNEYIERTPNKTDEEIAQEIAWCEKMLSRTVREDAEGYYRWHWLLMDSLEIYFDIKQIYYHGPKKALKYMEISDPEAFVLYYTALKTLNRQDLVNWISFLQRNIGT